MESVLLSFHSDANFPVNFTHRRVIPPHLLTFTKTLRQEFPPQKTSRGTICFLMPNFRTLLLCLGVLDIFRGPSSAKELIKPASSGAPVFLARQKYKY